MTFGGCEFNENCCAATIHRRLAERPDADKSVAEISLDSNLLIGRAVVAAFDAGAVDVGSRSVAVGRDGSRDQDDGSIGLVL